MVWSSLLLLIFVVGVDVGCDVVVVSVMVVDVLVVVTSDLPVGADGVVFVIVVDMLSMLMMVVTYP